VVSTKALLNEIVAVKIIAFNVQLLMHMSVIIDSPNFVALFFLEGYFTAECYNLRSIIFNLFFGPWYFIQVRYYV